MSSLEYSGNSAPDSGRRKKLKQISSLNNLLQPCLSMFVHVRPCLMVCLRIREFDASDQMESELFGFCTGHDWCVCPQMANTCGYPMLEYPCHSSFPVGKAPDPANSFRGCRPPNTVHTSRATCNSHH